MAKHSNCVVSPTMPYCCRIDVIFGCCFKNTSAADFISGKPGTFALQKYRPAVSLDTVNLSFFFVPTTFG